MGNKGKLKFRVLYQHSRITIPSIRRTEFRENNVLDFPPRNPDLNITENVWRSMIKELKKLNRRHQNRQELVEVVHTAWEIVNQNYCTNVYNSILNSFFIIKLLFCYFYLHVLLQGVHLFTVA